ncbi:MAG: uroporphyrinogen decarboxylase family protein [Armatimonadota bacterium]
MTNRERVCAALEYRQPDRTPYQIGFTEKAKAAMDEYYGGDGYLELIDNCLHRVEANPGPKEGWIDDDVWQDEFGVQWDRSVDRDIGNPCNRLLPKRDLCGLEMPDPASDHKFGDFEQKLAEAGECAVSFGIGFSLFERAWTLRGMEKLFIDMMEAPHFVHDLLDMICDYNIALVEKGVQYDIDIVQFGDDWGSQEGLLMGRRLWEKFIKPRLARQYTAVKDTGKFLAIHSCGRVQEVFPDLIELGLDCFNPFQPEVMDVYEMKDTFGGRLAFWGGISTQQLLPYGTPPQVREVVNNTIEYVGNGGGYICGPAHAIPGDAKPENIMAMIETLNAQ